jgi:hypothetical protein
MRMRDFIRIIETSENPVLPERSFRVLWHVGTLNASDKRTGSHEGSGLSVSLHPEEWRLIARGHVTGPTWRCTKPGNRFIDAHRLNDDQRHAVEEWAIHKGLGTRSTTYRIARYDDELDHEYYLPFRSIGEAEAEAADGDEIEEVPGDFIGTHSLHQRTKSSSLALSFDLALTAFAEDHGYDGVWWDDRLDVTGFSAPRGVVVPSRVSEWKFDQQSRDQDRVR